MIYDVGVIGGGPGGYYAAEIAAQQGLQVILFEQEYLGGVCLNEGCIPSKTILKSAKLVDAIRHAGDYGVDATLNGINQDKILERKNRVVQQLVSGVEFQMKSHHVTVVPVTARITARTREGFVIEAGGERYQSRTAILAVGSVPIIPPIPGMQEGLSGGFCLTSREALSLESIPERMVIIGAGAIGLEMAFYYQSMGCQVDVIEMLPQIAPTFDVAMARLLHKSLENKGIKFHLNASVTEIRPGGVLYNSERSDSIACDKVLVSVGRKGRGGGSDLQLEMERSFFKAGEDMQTSIPDLYAIGDCNGRVLLAHVAYKEAQVAVDQILGKTGSLMDYAAVPNVIYTSPELASVGYTLNEAKNLGFPAREHKLRLAGNGRYLAEENDPRALAKLVYSEKTGVVLGVSLLSASASEVIAAAAIITERKIKVNEILSIMFAHPTVSEIFRDFAVMSLK